MARLQDQYKAEIVPKLKEKFGYRNVMQVPKLSRSLVTWASGMRSENFKGIETAAAEIRSSPARSRGHEGRKSIANFKLREGSPSASWSRSGGTMLPTSRQADRDRASRVRTSRGFPRRGSTGRGNYTLGIKEQIMFPEVNYDKIEKIRGMNITSSPRPGPTKKALAPSAHGNPFGVSKRGEQTLAKKSIIAKSKRTPKFASEIHRGGPALRQAAAFSGSPAVPDLPAAARPRGEFQA